MKDWGLYNLNLETVRRLVSQHTLCKQINSGNVQLDNGAEVGSLTKDRYSY